MRKLLIDLLLAAGLIISFLAGGMRTFAQECERAPSQVLRLHIPANSDSEYDQQIKLQLRDLILSEYGALLAEYDSLSSAIERAESLLPEIERSACGFLSEMGAGYSAKAELTEMYFTTRSYEDITLPAGEYTALRITLGSGEGKNWWCVMFPPLCIPVVSEFDESAAEPLPDSFSDGVEVKFALFEFISKLLDS